VFVGIVMFHIMVKKLAYLIVMTDVMDIDVDTNIFIYTSD